MGEIRDTPRVLLLMAVFCRHETLFDLVRGQAEKEFGPVELESDCFYVDAFTDYYSASMGKELLKKIWGFRELFDPARLAEVKRLTNDWEEKVARSGKYEEPRPLNLDPGYLDLGKLVLASTKDHGHRIYLNGGVFAEVTLVYTRKHWTALPWSYADYQSDTVKRFLDRCRNYLFGARKQDDRIGNE